MTDDELAKILWDFNQEVGHVEPSDIILALGSHDTRVADRAVELYQQGIAPLILFAGGLGRLTDKKWHEPEADTFAKIAIAKGVPAQALIIENQSTNTGENIGFAWNLLQKSGLNPQRFQLVHKPYMMWRAWATFKKQLPEKEVSITCPQFTYENYPSQTISKKDVISIMVGDIQRLSLYPIKGFQIPVEIPEKVTLAFKELVSRGYTEQLVQE
jgi:uncharacterized SAM-binding protein YcdF (DUF218 family)